MRPQRAVDAAAFDAQDDAQVDGDPFDFAAGAAVGAPAVALVVVPDRLEEFGGVVFEAVAFAADVDWAGADCDSSVDGVCGGGWVGVVVA